MQFSQLEREMHNSPLKCTTNSEAMASPDKNKSSPKLQAQAYHNSGSKHHSPSLVSPTKTTSISRPQYSPSPDKKGALRGENIRIEDPSMRSPPQKKYSSPQRSSAAKRSSPLKE